MPDDRYVDPAITSLSDSIYTDPRYNPIAFLPADEEPEDVARYGQHAKRPPSHDLPVFAAVRSDMHTQPETTSHGEGDPDTLAALTPVDLVVTDDDPTASPPDTWDFDAHLDELRADPDVSLTED